MSKRYFFKVPNSIVPFIDTDKIPNRLYNGNWINPTLVDKIMYDFDTWKENADLDLTYFDSEVAKYNYIVNANWLAKNFIPNLMESSYDATWHDVSVGSEHGVNIRAYYSSTDNCYYVYTMNRWKRNTSLYKRENGKCYFICIYKIPYEMFYHIYGEQNKYEFYIYQYPTGVKFDFINDTEKAIYQKEMNDNWDYRTNIKSESWPFMKAWWRRNNN